MAVRFRKSNGVVEIKDHNDLLNRGERTHDEIDLYLDEIDEARGQEASLNDRLVKIENLTSKDFMITDCYYDGANDKLVLSINGGRASVNGKIIGKANETYEILFPQLNTTYYIFLRDDGVFFSKTDNKEDNNSMLIGSVVVGSSFSSININDLRYFLTKGGGGNPETSQEVIEARTDVNGVVFPSLKARLDYMQTHGGSGGGVDESRIQALENSLSTVTKTFTEKFENDPLVDYENTSAIVGRGYVKVAKTATVNETFDTTDNIDMENSRNIVVKGGKVTIKDLDGMLLSKEFLTAGTDFAKINPIINHYSAYSFSQVNEIANKISNSKTLQGDVVVDRHGRIWYIYGENNGSIYCKVYNSDGTVYLDEFIIPNASFNVGNSDTTLAVRACVDYDDKIWIFYGRNNSQLYLVILNQDGSIFKNSVCVFNAGGGGSHYFLYYFDVLVDRNNRVWVCFYNDFHYSISKGFYIIIFNNDGSIFLNPTNIQTSLSYGKLIYDSLRDKIIVTGVSKNYIYFKSFNLDGTIYKDASFSLSGDDVTSGYNAFYDEEQDKIICFKATSYANGIRMYRVNPDTFQLIDYKNYALGNIAYLKPVTGEGSYLQSITDAYTSTPYWRAFLSNNPYFIIDLLDVYKVKSFIFDNTGVNTTGYTIAVSMDGQNYIDVAVESGLIVGEQRQTILENAVEARYIKVYNFSSSDDKYAYCSEFKVFIDEEEATYPVSSQGNYMSVIKDGSNYHIAYCSDKENATYYNIHFCTIRNDFTMVNLDVPVTSDAAYHDKFPVIYKHPDGSLRILYASNRLNANYAVLDEAIYTDTPTSARFYLSNDGGLTWIEAVPNEQVNFPIRNNRLRVKIELFAPISNPRVSPELLGYVVEEWNSDNGGVASGVFVSSRLPFDEPVSRLMLTAVQTLNGGTIDWYVSSDGGATWNPIELGKPININNFQFDIRVKAEIYSPLEASFSPEIRQYTVVATNMVLQGDFQALQINLMKTNFKLDSFTNATRNGMKNLVIDVFNDTSGIDNEKSSYTYDDVMKCVKNGTVVSIVENTDIIPVRVLLTVDETRNNGSIEYYVSRDGGTTWTQITPEVVSDLSLQPVNNKLVVKAVISGDAQLNAWAYAWS